MNKLGILFGIVGMGYGLYQAYDINKKARYYKKLIKKINYEE